VSFAVITLCVASQTVFVVLFPYDSVRKLLDTLSYCNLIIPGTVTGRPGHNNSSGAESFLRRS
jgi:hypothetical protein